VVIGSLATAVISDRAFFIVFVPLEFLPRLFGKPPVELAIQKESANIGKRGANSRFASTTRDSFNLTFLHEGDIFDPARILEFS
jgi:hypothetical protein